MIEIIIYLAIFVILAIIVYWLLSMLTLPEPLRTIIVIACVVIGAVIVISILLSFLHGGGLPLRLGEGPPLSLTYG